MALQSFLQKAASRFVALFINRPRRVQKLNIMNWYQDFVSQKFFLESNNKVATSVAFWFTKKKKNFFKSEFTLIKYLIQQN